MPRLTRWQSMGAPVYVLAPSYRHFRTWCQEHDRSPNQMRATPDAVYLYKLEKLESARLERPRIDTVDGWEDKRGAQELWARLVELDARTYRMGLSVRSLAWPWPGAEPEAGATAWRGPEYVAGPPAPGYTERPPESSAERVTALLMGTFGMQAAPAAPVPRDCPCAQCCRERERSQTATQRGLPPLSPGMSHVYLINGPAEGQVRALRDDHDRLSVHFTQYNTPTHLPFTSPEGFPYTTTYAIPTILACTLRESLDMRHEYGPWCTQHLRIGCVIDREVQGADVARHARRILDLLTPNWWSAGQMQPGAQLRTFSNMPPLGLRPREAVAPAPSPVADPDAWEAPVPALPDTRPVTRTERDWPRPDRGVGNGAVCEHVCGGDDDHVCDARASTTIRYRIFTGGYRTMPVCGPCEAAELFAIQAEEEESRGKELT